VRELDISATPADVRALETLQTGLDTAAERGDYDRVEQLDLEFHRPIYRLAGTPKISWLLGATLRNADHGNNGSQAPTDYYDGSQARADDHASTRDHQSATRAGPEWSRDTHRDANKLTITVSPDLTDIPS